MKMVCFAIAKTDFNTQYNDNVFTVIAKIGVNELRTQWNQSERKRWRARNIVKSEFHK